LAHGYEILVKFSLGAQLDVVQKELNSHPSWRESDSGVSSWLIMPLSSCHLLLRDGALPLDDSQQPLLFRATLADSTSSGPLDSGQKVEQTCA